MPSEFSLKETNYLCVQVTVHMKINCISFVSNVIKVSHIFTGFQFLKVVDFTAKKQSLFSHESHFS